MVSGGFGGAFTLGVPLAFALALLDCLVRTIALVLYANRVCG
jgi:mannose/fructose/N-acetylgalactosamine-specific phosphotransferase system component IIC